MTNTPRAVWVAAACIGLSCFAYLVFAGPEDRALDVACLRDLGHAIEGYRNVHRGELPPGTTRVDGLPPEKGYSWIVPVLPYFENASMYAAIDFGKPWDDPANANVAATRMIKKSTDPKSWAFRFDNAPNMAPGTPYVGIAGVGEDAAELPLKDSRAGVFGYDRHLRAEDIVDGASTTMMVAGTKDVSAHWMQGGPATIRGVDPRRRPHLGRGRPFGDSGGAPVLFVDGSVRWLKSSTEPEIFEAMATIRGGERVPEAVLGELQGQ